MSDYVVMPKGDYVSACDAIRAKTGGAALIKSGDMAGQISGIGTGGKIETCSVEFVSTDWPRDSEVVAFIRTLTGGQDMYDTYTPGYDAFGNVAHNNINDVVCGSYIFLKKDVNYLVDVASNAEIAFDMGDTKILKITAGPGETATLIILYNDF